jgi:hypothetical protein
VIEKIVQTLVAVLATLGLNKLIPRVRRWFAAHDVVKEQLRDYRSQVEVLRTTVRTTAGPLWDDATECRRQCVALEQEVLGYLTVNAPEHVARFNSDLSKTPERYQPNAPHHVSDFGNFLERRLQALDDIIEKL